jgi:hypothetical protein
MIDYSSPASSIAFETSPDDMPALPLWTFTLGLLALLTFGLTSVPAIICGHRALAAPKRPGSESLERYVTIAGLVIGYLGAGLLAVWIALLAKFLAGH